jgi:NADPH2:quinone reductase
MLGRFPAPEHERNVMKAIVMTAVGGRDVLALRDLPEPALGGPHDLLVRVKAAGVNPVDTKLRGRGTFYPDRLPCVLGCDGAGVVEAVGAAVQRFRPGDAVYFCHGGIGGDPGCYAEYTVVDERHAAAKPRSLDFAEAAAAPLVLITAWESLHDRGRVHADQTVLVHAGAGGVGHVAIQLARRAGCRVAATVGSEAKAALARELGAEETLLYRDTDFADATLSWTDGVGVDLALDTVGAGTFVKSFAAVRHYGDLVTLLQPSPDTDWKVARLRNLRISLELMLTPMYDGLADALEHQAGVLAQCAHLFDEGRLRVVVSDRLPLTDAAEAHRRIEAGGMTGKLVLEVA